MNVSVSSQRRKETHSEHAIAYYDPRYRAGSGRLRSAIWNDDLHGGNPLLEIVCYFLDAVATSREYFRRNENSRHARDTKYVC